MAARAGARSTAGKSTAKSGAKVAIPQLSWSKAAPASVVLITGPEEFLADRAYRSIRDQLRAQDQDLEISEVDASGYSAGVLTTLASPSLFGEPRLVRVSSVEKCTDDFILDAVRYLEDPAEGAVIVLRHSSGVRGKKLLDAVRSGSGGGIEILCTELKKDAEKYEFAAEEFRAARRSVTPGALRALVAAFSDDVAELAAACSQLLSDASGEITEQTVDKYYSGRVETNAFAVADAAIAGRYGAAMALLRHALDTGAAPAPLVAAFAMKLRGMAKVQGSYGSSGSLAGSLGMAPWQIDRARRDLSGWSEQQLGRCIRLLAETDENIKGGSRDQVFALERMVAGIARRS